MNNEQGEQDEQSEHLEQGELIGEYEREHEQRIQIHSTEIHWPK